MNAERPSMRAWLLSDAPASRSQAALGLAYRRWRRFAANPLNLFGLAILVALIVVAILSPFLMPHDPLQQVLADRLLPPGSPSHWLGTDQLGRDILSRLIGGSRITLGIALLLSLIHI